MRLDKYLKVSRLVKRRVLAKELVDSGHVSINGKTAKASSEIKVNDIISIKEGNVVSSYIVRQILENATTEKAETMYERMEP